MDLQKFCSKNALKHHWALAPFNQGDRTYATDGHVLVSVPRREDVADDKIVRPDMIKEFAKFAPSEWFAVPAVELETCKHCKGKVVDYPCHECGGSGHPKLESFYHVYLDVECASCDGEGEVSVCPYCNMTGFDAPDLVPIGAALFKANLLNLIKDLPGIEISPTGPETPAYLRFNGGEGYIMPAKDIS